MHPPNSCERRTHSKATFGVSYLLFWNETASMTYAPFEWDLRRTQPSKWDTASIFLISTWVIYMRGPPRDCVSRSVSVLKYQIIWPFLWQGKVGAGCKMSSGATPLKLDIYKLLWIFFEYNDIDVNTHMYSRREENCSLLWLHHMTLFFI